MLSWYKIMQTIPNILKTQKKHFYCLKNLKIAINIYVNIQLSFQREFLQFHIQTLACVDTGFVYKN